MPFTMHLSPAFQKQKRACDAYKARTDQGTPVSVAQSVYLIYRVNGDDTTMSTIFSQSYQNAAWQGEGGISPALRGASGIKVGKGKVKYETITRTSPNQGGGHAEEIFIRSLDKIAADLTGAQYTIRGFEIFTSKIPCFKDNNTGSSAFLLGETLFIEGCGKKLNQLAETRSDIQWDLCYETDYAGTAVHDATIREMLLLKTLPNASVVRYTGPGVVKQIAHGDT